MSMACQWQIPSVLMALVFGAGASAADLTRTADHDYDPPAPGSYALPVITQATGGEVLDAKGRTVQLYNLVRDRVTVLSFIYSRCADPSACPYATGVLSELHEMSIGNRALTAGLRLISLSFDPVGDTPARMAAYAKVAEYNQPAAEWRFLTTASQAKLQPILDAYGQAVQRKENPYDPTGPLYHNLRVFLIDRSGRVRNIYSSGTLDVRLVLADVQTLLMEPRY